MKENIHRQLKMFRIREYIRREYREKMGIQRGGDTNGRREYREKLGIPRKGENTEGRRNTEGR
jgi:hypothetical protein